LRRSRSTTGWEAANGIASVRVYKRGADFATLPKLHINITPLGGVHVFDDRKRMKEEDVKVISVENHLIVRCHLRLLGDEGADFCFHRDAGEIS